MRSTDTVALLLALLCAVVAWRNGALETRVADLAAEVQEARLDLLETRAALRVVADRADDVDILLEALEAGEAVRCSWEMIPPAGRDWYTDASLHCRHDEPCALTMLTPLEIPR